MIACGRDILYVWELALAVSNTLTALKLNDWNEYFTATVSSVQREFSYYAPTCYRWVTMKGLTSWQPPILWLKGFQPHLRDQ